MLLLLLFIYSLQFFTSALADDLSLEIEWQQSLQASRTLLSILAVFNNAVVRMVSTQPSTSKSSRPFNNPLVTVPNAPITIGIIVTFLFHSFFNSLARSRYLFHILSVLFCGQPGQQSRQFCRFSFFSCWLLLLLLLLYNSLWVFPTSPQDSS